MYFKYMYITLYNPRLLVDVDSCTKSGSESFESAHVHFNLQNCFPTPLKYGVLNLPKWRRMRGHVRQVYGFSVLNLFTNPMPGPYFRTNLLMATLLGGSSLHSLTHPFLPSLGLLRVLWMLLFHTLRRLNLTQQLAMVNHPQLPFGSHHD